MTGHQRPHPGPLEVVRGQATPEELDAVHRALGRRRRAEGLRRWRAGRRQALRRQPEQPGDR